MSTEPTPERIPWPHTPWEALGPIVREHVLIEGRTFVISRPDESDRLLDNPAIRSAFPAHDYPPEGLRVPVVLASDLIYELRNVDPLVKLIRHVLAPGGTCLLTDQDRVPSYTLRETLLREGLTFTTQAMKAGEPGGRRVKGTL